MCLEFLHPNYTDITHMLVAEEQPTYRILTVGNTRMFTMEQFISSDFLCYRHGCFPRWGFISA